MIQPHLSLIVSIVFILLLIRRFHVSVAVFVGFLTIGFKSLEILYETSSFLQTVKYLVIFTLAFTLAYSMKESGVLDVLTKSALSVFGKSSVVVIPAMIGLLPMPGGAIVSAVMLKSVFEKFKVHSDRATFLNYWFRHILACLNPIYPSVILVLAILELNYPVLLKATYPVTILMVLAGLPFIRGTTGDKVGKEKYYGGLLYLSPILIVMILTVLGFDLLYSLAISVFVFLLF